jgi:hypothetical protein
MIKARESLRYFTHKDNGAIKGLEPGRSDLLELTEDEMRMKQSDNKIKSTFDGLTIERMAR